MNRPPEGAMGQPLLIRSRQGWKVPTGLLWLPLFGLALLLGTAYGLVGRTLTQQVCFIGLGFAVGLGGYVWAGVSIRCPTCRAPLLWKAMSEKAPNEWLSWLTALTTCPVCGSDGSIVRS